MEQQQCDLKPLPGTLSVEGLALVQRLEAYDMSFVFERLASTEYFTALERRLLEREFKRFIALAGFGIYPLAMIGPVVDEVWHQFILFTKKYREFCLSTVGLFIGHTPDTSMTPVPVVAGENLRSSFRHYFGEFPEIWFKGMTSETRQYYLQPTLKEKPPMEWSGWAGPEE
jgi:hypothetical protein